MEKAATISSSHKKAVKYFNDFSCRDMPHSNWGFTTPSKGNRESWP